MVVSDGSYRLGPDHGRLVLHTTREGMAARAGHDLTLEVTDWEGTATIVADDPSRCSVEITAKADSLDVVEGHGGVKPLTDGDRRDISKTIRDKVLHTDRYPTITFRSTTISGTLDGFTIEGEFAVHGQTHPLTVEGRAAGTPHEPRVTGGTHVQQTTWGITPYKGFLGALKVADAVGVEFDLALAPSDAAP